MQRLLQGVLNFRAHVFAPKRALFEQLAKGQNPEALFITCSDSRICPNLITQSDPGHLFTLRNAGNIVPPGSSSSGGESATIEYAIRALGIRDIVVCGHYHCGAMQGLLNAESVQELPSVGEWLSHADAARSFVEQVHGDKSKDEQLRLLVEANVLLQIEHLSTHPAVREALSEGILDIHGWVYRFETGDIYTYDMAAGTFLPLRGGETTLPLHTSPETVSAVGGTAV